MGVLGTVAQAVANHGNCKIYSPLNTDEKNYMIEISDDPFNLFSIYEVVYDKEAWHDENYNLDAEIIDYKLMTTGYDKDLMHTVLSLLMDYDLMGSDRKIALSYENTGKKNYILANELINASINAIDMDDYELLGILREEYEERIMIYWETMNYYSQNPEEEKHVPRHKRILKNYNMPTEESIAEGLAVLDDILDFTVERLIDLELLIEKLASSKTNEEKDFYISSIDQYCGGKGIVVSNNNNDNNGEKKPRVLH